MIDKENITELNLIVSLHNMPSTMVAQEIFNDAVLDAIKCNGDTQENIKLIIQSYPALIPNLIKIVNINFHEHKELVEKLAVLA